MKKAVISTDNASENIKKLEEAMRECGIQMKIKYGKRKTETLEIGCAVAIENINGGIEIKKITFFILLPSVEFLYFPYVCCFK